jgi:hypothetical protein
VMVDRRVLAHLEADRDRIRHWDFLGEVNA